MKLRIAEEIGTEYIPGAEPYCHKVRQPIQEAPDDHGHLLYHLQSGKTIPAAVIDKKEIPDPGQSYRFWS